MKLKIDKTPEIIELFARMASAKKDIAEPALEAFAAVFTNQLANVSLDQEITSNRFFEADVLSEGDDTLDLDPLWGPNAEEISVWSQSQPGGLPTNQVGKTPILKINYYDLYTAISFHKNWLTTARPEVVSRYMERMMNSLWVKADLNRWAVLLTALAQASTAYFPNGVSSTPVQHVIQGTTPGFFQVNDVNNLWTLVRRLNAAWTNRTPVRTLSKGLTHLVMGPERLGDVRSFAYQPMNTRGVPDSAESTVLGLPDSVRERIFNSAGATEIFGVELVEDLGFGPSQAYTNIFRAAAGATTYSNITGGGAATFGASADILIGIDANRRGLLAPQIGSPSILVDDQYRARDKTVGYWTELRTSALVTSDLALVGCIINPGS